MQINALTPEYAVAGQIRPEDAEAIVAAGFHTVVCNRPDGEVTGDEQSAPIRAAVEAAGLVFHYNPVVNGAMNEENVRLQGAALAESDGPVFAYCRSGMRCSVVWALARAPEVPADDLIEAAARAGYDLSGLRPQIAARQGT